MYKDKSNKTAKDYKKKKLNPIELLDDTKLETFIQMETNDCKVVNALQFYEEFKNSKILAIDIHGFNNNIKWIFICDEFYNLCILNFDQITKEQKEKLNIMLLSDKVKVIKDAKYIEPMLLSNNIKINKPIYDLYTAGKVIDSGLGSFSNHDELMEKYLGGSARSYCNWNYGITDYHIKQISKNMIQMYKLKAKLTDELHRLSLIETAKLEFECLPVILQIQSKGVKFHIEKYEALIKSKRNELSEIEEEIKNILGDIDLKNIDTILRTLQELRKKPNALITGGCTQTEIQQEVISKLKEHKKLANLLLRCNENLISYVDKNTMRVYPKYSQIESATGRIYCSHPNLQQFPRGKEFRECVIPEEGKKFIIADYSQIQLRIAAEMSGDNVMIEAFKSGQDIHRITASIITNKGIDNISEEERRAAKAVNFGLIYGMTANGLQEYAKSSYGVNMTLEEAKAFKDKFFQKYKGLKTWQEQCIQKSYNKVSRTIYGRRRVWKELPTPTEILNTPVQGSEADILKLALVKLDDELKTYDAHVVLIVHDEIVVEVAEDKAEVVKEIVVRSMIEAGQVLLHKVPAIVEVVIADYWQ